MERSDELTYLKYFYKNAEFGPAESTIRDMITAWFIAEYQKLPPQSYFDFIQIEGEEKFADDCSQEEIEQWTQSV